MGNTQKNVICLLFKLLCYTLHVFHSWHCSYSYTCRTLSTITRTQYHTSNSERTSSSSRGSHWRTSGVDLQVLQTFARSSFIWFGRAIYPCVCRAYSNMELEKVGTDMAVGIYSRGNDFTILPRVIFSFLINCLYWLISDALSSSWDASQLSSAETSMIVHKLLIRISAIIGSGVTCVLVSLIFKSSKLEVGILRNFRETQWNFWQNHNLCTYDIGKCKKVKVE